MFSFLCGEVCAIGEGNIVLKNNDIGYNIFIPENTLFEMGNRVQLYTHLHIREDSFTLYGFKTEIEKKFFLKLLSVSGVGPRLAMAILGNFQVEHLLKIILGGDTVSLSSVKGVGKKCAERIILELREKVAVADLTVLEEIKNSMENTEPYSLKKEVRDATDALIMLGYTRNMAEKATNEAAAEGAETIENIIKLALKKFQRGV